MRARSRPAPLCLKSTGWKRGDMDGRNKARRQRNDRPILATHGEVVASAYAPQRHILPEGKHDDRADRNTIETACAGQAPWDIGRPQQASRAIEVRDFWGMRDASATRAVYAGEGR